jgi:chromosome segregation ATPase
MDDLDAFRDELTALEAIEARLSAERRRLHQQIDFGYSMAETLRAREREISDRRQALHRRIDSLQQLLGIETTTTVAAGEAPVRELAPDAEPERPQDLRVARDGSSRGIRPPTAN